MVEFGMDWLSCELQSCTRTWDEDLLVLGGPRAPPPSANTVQLQIQLIFPVRDGTFYMREFPSSLKLSTLPEVISSMIIWLYFLGVQNTEKHRVNFFTQCVSFQKKTQLAFIFQTPFQVKWSITKFKAVCATVNLGNEHTLGPVSLNLQFR